MYRVNFSGSSDIKIYSIRRLQRVLRDAKRNKYGSAVKCGTAGKRKCCKVRNCGVKGYAVKCGTAGQGVKLNRLICLVFKFKIQDLFFSLTN